MNTRTSSYKYLAVPSLPLEELKICSFGAASDCLQVDLSRSRRSSTMYTVLCRCCHLPIIGSETHGVYPFMDQLQVPKNKFPIFELQLEIQILFVKI